MGAGGHENILPRIRECRRPSRTPYKNTQILIGVLNRPSASRCGQTSDGREWFRRSALMNVRDSCGAKFRSRSVPLAANPVAHAVAPHHRLLELMAFGRAHFESALTLNCLPGRSCHGVGVFDLQRDDCPMAYVFLRHFKIGRRPIWRHLFSATRYHCLSFIVRTRSAKEDRAMTRSNWDR